MSDTSHQSKIRKLLGAAGLAALAVVAAPLYPVYRAQAVADRLVEEREEQGLS